MYVTLGPPTHKKPKQKPVKFINGLFGYIDWDASLQTGTELFAVGPDEEFYPVESGSYELESGEVINVENGVIS